MKNGSIDFEPARRLAVRFLRDERGATALEYGMIVGFISIVVIGALGIIGETMRDDIFGAVVSALSVGAGSD